ncbi:MAG: PcfJ domain-containing protein [Verrucomicrobiae bacterium]|nr:PcfJ domain-containing protein [Verrucomicrobiae bacterium]
MDAAGDDPQPRSPLPAGDVNRLGVKDLYMVLRHGWCNLTQEELDHGEDRAIATLERHPYFQAGAGIGFDTPSHRFLKIIVEYHLLWQRPVTKWVPPNGDAFTCLSDLFAHLFFLYDVPQWLDPQGGPEDREWDDPNWLTLAIFTGRGGSLHEGLAYLCMDPVGKPLLTRLGVRQFTEAPRHLPFWDAVRHALILDSGGDLPATQDFRAFGDIPALMFAAPVVRALAPWLARNRDGIVPGMGVLMIHWAHAAYRDFQRRQVDAHDGVPPQNRTRPFTIKRRSLRSVIAEILGSLTDLRNPLCRQLVHHTWPSQGWDRTLRIADVEWTIRELCTVGDLAREGHEMNHCAIQCLQICATGESVLFSVSNSREARVTLQICPHTFRLLQIRGPGNRAPSPEEEAATDAWRRAIESQPNFHDRQTILRNPRGNGVHPGFSYAILGLLQ